MRGEVDALRGVARRASEALDALGSLEGEVGGASLRHLRAAFDDLRRRYPYSLEPRGLGGGPDPLLDEVLGRRTEGGP